MSTLRTPASVYARMTEVGFTNIRETVFGIEWGEPYGYELEHQRLKTWVRSNYAAFAAYLRELPPRKSPRAAEREPSE